MRERVSEERDKDLTSNHKTPVYRTLICEGIDAQSDFLTPMLLNAQNLSRGLDLWEFGHAPQYVWHVQTDCGIGKWDVTNADTRGMLAEANDRAPSHAHDTHEHRASILPMHFGSAINIKSPRKKNGSCQTQIKRGLGCERGSRGKARRGSIVLCGLPALSTPSSRWPRRRRSRHPTAQSTTPSYEAREHGPRVRVFT